MSSDGENKPVLSKTSPRKRKSHDDPASPSKKPKITDLKPAPPLPDGSPRKSADPEAVMTLMTLLMEECTPEMRTAVAKAYGIEARLFHMSWSTVMRKKILKILKEGLEKNGKA